MTIMCGSSSICVGKPWRTQVVVTIGLFRLQRLFFRGLRRAVFYKVGHGAPVKGCSTWLASADPRKTGCGFTYRRADAALMQRLRQGLRERDGQERATRWTASLMGTWSGQHRSGSQMETGDIHCHPAVPMGMPE